MREAITFLANPLWVVLAYVIYRVLFTDPGRPPLEEDMTHED